MVPGKFLTPSCSLTSDSKVKQLSLVSRVVISALWCVAPPAAGLETGEANVFFGNPQLFKLNI